MTSPIRSAVAALALLAAPAQAQVDLRGAPLAEGAVVETVAEFRTQTDWLRTGDARVDSFSIHTAYADSSQFRVEAVEDGELTALRWTQSATWRSRRIEDGRVVSDETRPFPSAGHPIRIEREGDDWRYRAAGPSTPALDDFLAGVDGTPPDLLALTLDRTARVGESWDVPLDVQLATGYRLLPDSPQRLRVRLDSVGTWEGGAAAFLSFEGEQWQAFVDGVKHVERSGRHIRRLDLGLTVATDETRRTVTEQAGTFGDGTPMRARMTAKWTLKTRRALAHHPG